MTLDNLNAGDLIRIPWRDGETPEFVGKIITEFNQGNRVIFLCRTGDESKILARIRIKITRVRTKLVSKGIPIYHWNMYSDSFPYTNRQGQRLTATVLRKVIHPRHKIKETLEGIVYGNEHGRLDEEITSAKSKPRELEW